MVESQLVEQQTIYKQNKYSYLCMNYQLVHLGRHHERELDWQLFEDVLSGLMVCHLIFSSSVIHLYTYGHIHHSYFHHGPTILLQPSLVVHTYLN